jgi:hypothetical protein
LTVSKLIWVDKNVVQAKAGSYLGNMGSDGCLYTLKKQNDAWEMSSALQCFIS